MTTDFRALCAELIDVWDAATDQDLLDMHEAIERARAALAKPEPDGPTNQEIEEWADACSEAPLEELDPEVHGWRRCFTAQEFSKTIRAALARWGRSDGPAVPDGREPASVTAEPSDDELLSLEQLRNAWNAQADAANNWDELGVDEIIWWAQRQALARWGLPTTEESSAAQPAAPS